MTRTEFLDTLRYLFASEEENTLIEIIDIIPDKVFLPIRDMVRINGGPRREDGEPIPAEYEPQTKTIRFYENSLDPNHLYHEIGHSIYHTFYDEIGQTLMEEHSKDPLNTIGDSESEFLAQAYELWKSGNPIEHHQERFRLLIEFLKEHAF